MASLDLSDAFFSVIEMITLLYGVLAAANFSGRVAGAPLF